MNDTGNRQFPGDPETQISALLLGELSPGEAELVRAWIANDPALVRLEDRLRQTIGLVRQTVKPQAEIPAQVEMMPLPEGPRLSEERRGELLARFKVVPMEQPVARPRRRSYLRPLLRLAAVLIVVALLAGMLLPSLTKARSKGQSVALRSNLRAFDGAKQQWALENKKSPTDIPTMEDLRPYLGRGGQGPAPIAGETYSLGSVGEPVTAEFDPGKAKALLGRRSVANLDVAGDQLVRMNVDGKIDVAGAGDRGLDSGATFSKAGVEGRKAGSFETAAVPGEAGGSKSGGLGGGGGGELAGYAVSKAEPSRAALAERVQIVLPTVVPEDNTTAWQAAGGRAAMGEPEVRFSVPSVGNVPASVLPPPSDSTASRPVAPKATLQAFHESVVAGGQPAGQTAESQQLVLHLYGMSPAQRSAVGGAAPAAGPAPARPMQPEAEIPPKTDLLASVRLGIPVETPRVAANAPTVGSDYATPAITPAVPESSGTSSVANGLARGGAERYYADTSSLRELAVEDRVPILGDEPMLGRRFRGAAPVAGVAGVPANDAEGADRLGLMTEVMRQLGADRSLQRGSYAEGVVSQSAPSPESARGRQLVQEGKALYEGGRIDEARERLIEATRVDPKDPAALYYLNLAKEAETLSRGVDGLGGISGKEVASLSADAKQQRAGELRRDIEALKGTRDAIQNRVLEGEVDVAKPESRGVEVFDASATLPDRNPSLLSRIGGVFGGNVERSARVAVDKDELESAPPAGLAQKPAVFDPYFIQTEAEKVQSKSVLDQVIDKLDLADTWGVNPGADSDQRKEQTLELLRNRLAVEPDANGGLMDIRVKGANADEAARIANTIAEVYREERLGQRQALERRGIETLKQELVEQNKQLAGAQAELARLQEELEPKLTDLGLVVATEEAVQARPAQPAPEPQPEITTADNPYSTFSLNVSDVSFKLAVASLEQGQAPDPASIRSEEFINAFQYHDPEPAQGQRIGVAWERARYPFAHNRDLVRFSVKTAARGREAARPLNLVLCLDNSGSMERADRVRILREALAVLAGKLQASDRISVVAFARTARLWVDALPGDQAGALLEQLGELNPEGGTNFEDALRLAYGTAARHHVSGGVNRVVMLTDGAANLGDVEPESLRQMVIGQRQLGIALDCFGVGWEGFNDDLLENLSRNGDGRYGFLNSVEEASTEFAGQLAGALQVAASDVKVQVEFNPRRVLSHRQIGYAKHQLTQEQFRDNTVDAAEIGAAEAGNALYVVQTDPHGVGPVAVVRVRHKIPETGRYEESEWVVPYEGPAPALEQASPTLRLAGTASAFSEWLAGSPFAGGVTTDQLLRVLRGVPELYALEPRPKQLEWMIRQAGSLSGK